MTAMYTPPADSTTSHRQPVLRPLGKPFKSVSDVQTISVLGLGLVVGAVIGAGVALLIAPQTGEDARASLSRRVRRARGQPVGPWERLGRELRRAATLKRKEREMASASRRADAELATPALKE